MRVAVRLGNDPIAALATPMGQSGVAVIRSSGAAILSRISPLLRPFSPSLAGNASAGWSLSPRTMHLMHLLDGPGGLPIDQVFVVHFPAPRSFTGEDLVEIHCHGAPVIIHAIMHQLVGIGIRPADPGEFTRRAYLHGKLDLVQAEAILNLIHASSLRAAKEATRQLQGSLSQRLAQIRHELIQALAHLEAYLDFPDEEISPMAVAEIRTTVARAQSQVARLVQDSAWGERLREGYELAIVGRPNGGKSSLFNRLLGKERAIVSEVPGTTRDYLEYPLQVNGIPVRLFDTAGIRLTGDAVEQAGVERSWERLRQADALLLVVDGQWGVQEADREILAEIDRNDLLVIFNKVDLLREEERAALVGPFDHLLLSCVTGEGIDVLKEAIAQRFSQRTAQEEGATVMVARQRHGLSQMLEALHTFDQMLTVPLALEIAALPLRQAMASLAEITGEIPHAEILDAIFNQFCIGK